MARRAGLTWIELLVVIDVSAVPMGIVMEYTCRARMDIYPNHVTHRRQLVDRQLTGDRIVVADACFRLGVTHGHASAWCFTSSAR